jgi:molybdenum cofactor cytidylyltransferase
VHLISLAAGDAATTFPAHAIVAHDVRNPEQRSEVLVRKGTELDADALAALLARSAGELHLAVPEPGDIAENDVAPQLARAVAGQAVDVGDARHGQVSFSSGSRGLLRIDAARLDAVNAQDGVLLLTAEPDRPVEHGMTLGVIKCAPLFLAQRTLEAVQAIGAVLEVQAFRAMCVGLVAPTERLRGGGFERARTALSEALEWYGSTLDPVVGAEASVDGMAGAYRQLVSAGSELILAAGASGTDPLDVVFEGLRRAGGQVDQIGVPAEPGTACWIGHLESVPVLGLASCELFGQPGALDLLLPRLFTGEPLDRGLVRRLALGGLLLGPGRVAPHHAGRVTAEMSS